MSDIEEISFEIDRHSVEFWSGGNALITLWRKDKDVGYIYIVNSTVIPADRFGAGSRYVVMHQPLAVFGEISKALSSGRRMRIRGYRVDQKVETFLEEVPVRAVPLPDAEKAAIAALLKK